MIDIFGIIFGLIFMIFAILSIFYIISLYNGLIVLRNKIEQSWADVDVMLKQRSDLIPNLVETVKGYMKYEKKTLEAITKLRAKLLADKSPEKKALASEAISAGLRTIFAVSERYPELKANGNFMKLQSELTNIENRISNRRRIYNDSVLLFNTRIALFPDSLIANLLGMKKAEYFKAGEDERRKVVVKL